MLMSIFFFVLTPVMLTYTRHIEHEADRFGLELTHDNHNAATAFVKLQQENLGNPRPGMLYKLWRSSHPTLGDRIDFCNDYKPWESGNTMRYSGLFRE
jgi:Zn-dependent protease with chaperone function